MVYSNKFVMAVIVDGHPQKELANGVVKLPFGTQYSLRFRNKNNRRAVVKIYVDGENVSGNGYVIPANDYVDIKRHHDKDRAFKFVSLDSAEAVDFGKNGPNPDKVKGTIEAHFYLEKEQPAVKEIHHHHHHDHHHYPKPDPWPNPWPIRPLWYNASGGQEGGQINWMADGGGGATYGTNEPIGSSEIKLDASAIPSEIKLDMSAFASEKGIKTCSIGGQHLNRATRSYSPPPAPAPELKDGCTVEGYTTGQRFTTTWIETEDSYTTLQIFLQGYEEDEVEAVVEAKPKKSRKTNKDHRLDDLESENEELRRKIAEMENEKLKEKLKELET